MGSPRGATIRSTALTDRASLRVNVANGNLLVQNNDLHVTGTGPDQSMDRTYNNLSAASGGPGNGWTMSGARSPSLLGYGGSDIVYAGPDGGSYAFHYDLGTAAYDTPPGIDATLCNIYQSGCQAPSGSTWGLRFRDGGVLGFDIAGDLVYRGDQNGNHLSYAYNASGTVSQIADTQGRTTTLGYATNPNLLASVTDAAYPAGGRSTLYGQDASGNLTSYTDASTNRVLYSYDANRNLTQITDPGGHVTKLAYDSTGRVTSVLQVTNNALGTGDTTTYAYNATAFLIPGTQIICPSHGAGPFGWTQVTDPNGHVSAYCFDTHDRAYVAYDAKGQSHQSGYTLDDNLTTSTQPSGDVFTASYDGTDRPCKLLNPSSASGQTAVSTSVLYAPQAASADACNAARSTTDHPFYPDSSFDASGNQLTYGYDPAPNNNLNRVQSQLPAQNKLALAHNANGTLSSSTDANLHQTSYGYDTLGNRTSLTPPAPLHADAIVPDAVSRVSSSTDGNQKTTGYQYDKLDRVVEADYADGSKINYTYDPDGNLTRRVDTSAGTSSYTYDLKSRLTQQALPNVTTTYGYDGTNNLTSIQDGGGSVSYGYDSTNLLAQAQESNASTPITFQYDQNSQRTCTTYPTGVVVNDSYDHAGHLLSTLATNGTGAACASTAGTHLSEDDYSYSNGIKDTGLVQTHTVAHGSGARTAIQYLYDPLNRVTSAVSMSGGSQTDSRQYVYDGAGNITSRTINGTTTSGSFNAANELTSQGSTSYSYDPNGNELGSSAGLAFGYNARNQTSSLTLPGQQAFSLAYQGISQNELSSSGGLTIGNNILGVGSLPQTGVDFTRTNDSQLLSQRQGSSANSNYLTDKLSSVVGVTDHSGNLANTYSYDPYGAITNNTGSTSNPFGYAQGLSANTASLTPTSNLYHYGARYYDAGIGRWTQQDPINQPADPVQSNEYAYAGDNPVNNLDPSGQSIFGDIGHVISQGATFAYNGVTGCLTGAEIGGAAGLAVASPEAGAALGCVAGAGAGQFTPTQPYNGSGYPKYGN